MKKITSRQIALEAAAIARAKKAAEIMALDVRGTSDFCDYFVIATAGSLPQMNALEDEIVSTFKRGALLPYTTQRQPSNPPSPSWRIIDYGGAVINIMSPEARKFYQIEKLLRNAKKIPVSRRKSAKKSRPKKKQ